MKKAVVVVYGEDKVGIAYNVCKVLYENKINILDITQTILQENFSMMIIADVSNVKNYNKIISDFDLLSKTIGVKIDFQLADTVSSMHKV